MVFAYNIKLQVSGNVYEALLLSKITQCALKAVSLAPNLDREF